MFTRDELENIKALLESSTDKVFIGDGKGLYVHFGPNGEISTVDKASLATPFINPPEFFKGIARLVNATSALTSELNKMTSIVNEWTAHRNLH